MNVHDLADPSKATHRVDTLVARCARTNRLAISALFRDELNFRGHVSIALRG
jgi:hypothetical protein